MTQSRPSLNPSDLEADLEVPFTRKFIHPYPLFESCYDTGEGGFWTLFFHEVLLAIVVDSSKDCSNVLASDE